MNRILLNIKILFGYWIYWDFMQVLGLVCDYRISFSSWKRNKSNEFCQQEKVFLLDVLSKQMSGKSDSSKHLITLDSLYRVIQRILVNVLFLQDFLMLWIIFEQKFFIFLFCKFFLTKITVRKILLKHFLLLLVKKLTVVLTEKIVADNCFKSVIYVLKNIWRKDFVVLFKI